MEELYVFDMYIYCKELHNKAVNQGCPPNKKLTGKHFYASYWNIAWPKFSFFNLVSQISVL